MRDVLSEKCVLFAKNKELILKNFKWESDYMSTAAAAVFASAGQEIDIESMKNAERILKDNSKVFSEYRDQAKLPILLQMVRSGNPEECLEKIKSVYEKVMAKKVFSSTERMMAALVIVSNSDPLRFDHYAERTMSIYRKMKEKHFFLTDETDMPYAALLALSDIQEDTLVRDMEESFHSLKKLFRMINVNYLQSLSHILSLYENEPAEKTARVKELCKIMQDKKHRIPDGSVLPIFGAAAMMNDDLEKTAEELADTYDYMKSLKGLGSLSVDSNLRYVYAAMMVLNSGEHGETSAPNDTANSMAMAASLLAAITMQVCIIACMTSVAVMSSNTSN